MRNTSSQNIDKEPITDFERTNVIPIIIRGLYARIKSGRNDFISGAKMMDLLTEKKGIKVTNARFRKMIYHIRQNGVPMIDGKKYVLIAGGKGYKLSNNVSEISEFNEGLKSRLQTQFDTVNAVERDLSFIQNPRQKLFDHE